MPETLAAFTALEQRGGYVYSPPLGRLPNATTELRNRVVAP
jgi:hypothetical protein